MRLRAAGLSSIEADLSARALAAHLLGWTAERYLVDAIDAEPDGFAPQFDAALTRRAAREPLAYIVGSREFWGRDFEVTPDVLIPRPETELLVEAAIELHPQHDARIAVADVGTGSGCVAIAIALERTAASIVATDISSAALAVARRNAARHELSSRIRFVLTDLLDGVDGPFDLIVANPPYVRDGDSRGLQPEVRNEPDVALYGGAEGLDAITRLLHQAPPRLKSGGHLVFEFGLGQDLEIEHLVAATAALTLVELKRDLQGIARTAIARRA